MEKVDISDLEDLLNQFNSLANCFVFRGQANADWSMTSSLERLIGPDWDATKANKLEEFSLAEFKSRFHLYDTENRHPESKLSWLAAMQHYGVPTRLIDFTTSPYVALYFALESFSPTHRSDFSVFAIDYSATMKRSFERLRNEVPDFHETHDSLRGQQDKVYQNIVDLQARDVIWISEPSVLNRRLDKQAGCFLLSGNRSRRPTDVLTDDIYGGVTFTQYRIDAALYEIVFALLRKLNINSRTLYGDLDGLGRSIRMELQAYAC